MGNPDNPFSSHLLTLSGVSGTPLAFLAISRLTRTSREFTAARCHCFVSLCVPLNAGFLLTDIKAPPLMQATVFVAGAGFIVPFTSLLLHPEDAR